MMGLKRWAGLAALLVGQAAAANELVIGQVVALLEDKLQAGYQMNAGVELYFDAVNRAGGVHGRTLKLAVQGRTPSVPESVVKTRELVEEHKPIALVGLMGTAPMEALVKDGLPERAGLPIVGIRTGATSLHSPVHPWLFHTRASYAAEADKIVRHLSTLGLKRIAIFHENTGFGREALRHALAAMEKARLKPIATATYELNTTEVGEAVKTLQAAAPEAVIAAGSSAATAQLYKGLQQGGAQRIQVVAFSTVDAATVVKVIGRIDARGLGIAQVVPDIGNRRTPLVREFQDTVRKLRDDTFDLTQGALEGYLSAKVLVEGLRRAGPNPTAARLKAALEKMGGYDAGGVVIGFSPKNHSGSSYVTIGILASDGKLMN